MRESFQYPRTVLCVEHMSVAQEVTEYNTTQYNEMKSEKKRDMNNMK